MVISKPTVRSHVFLFTIVILTEFLGRRHGATMSQILPVVERLSPRVIRILGCNPGPFTLQGTNTYLIGNGSRRILLDTGEKDKPAYVDALKSVLDSESVELQEILLSHWHHDHVGGLNDIHACLTPLDDVPLWKFPRTDEPDEDPVVGSGEFSRTLRYRPILNGSLFRTEGATLEALHTPGHSTDHAVFHLKEEGVIFSADCILGEGSAVFEDLFDYMKSLSSLLPLDPKLIYPGHGPIVQDPLDKIRHYIAHRKERERQILAAVHAGAADVSAIVAHVYPGLADNLVRGAETNVGHHLSKLVKEGRVVQNGETYEPTFDNS